MNQVTNTNAIILLKAAKNLNIKTQIINIKPFKIKFSKNKKTHIIRAKSFNLNTSQQAKDIAKNKSLTLQTLALSNLPTPQHATVSNPLNYQDISIPFPQTIKPLTGEKGRYIFLNIQDKTSGQKAVNTIFEHYPSGAIIETYHQANDYRFLVLNFKVIGITQRLAPTITGNNKDSIKKLIQTENQQRHQQFLKTNQRLLNRMRNWPRLKWNLAQQNLSLDTILPQGKTITLYPIPNFSTGGSVTTIDLKSIHPSIKKLAQKTAKIIGLEIIGIDMLIKDLNQPVTPDNVTIIEVNSDPGLRLHDWPNQGKPQHVAEKILKSIFHL